MLPEPPTNRFGLPVVSHAADYHAQVATDPRQQLVDLATFAPELVLDIRYALVDNYFGQQLYAEAAAFLRLPVAAALRAAQADLREQGFGLKVFDAYRPYSATVRMFELLPDETYAAPPWRGSRHNRGCSVDVTLVDARTGQELPMPTAFDELTAAAHAGYAALPPNVLHHRATLHAALARHGFVNYAAEWWHFDHAQWAEFPLLDLPFAVLRDGSPVTSAAAGPRRS